MPESSRNPSVAPLLTCFALTVGASVAAVPIAAQNGSQPPNVAAVYVEQGPVIDGRLDEAIWGDAVLLDAFTQQEPDEGAPVSERTEVRLMYDENALYVGLHAFESSPAGVTATEMRRDSDQILSEDNFQIILDTFQDRRSGYMFVTNPLGAQLDQQVFNEGEGGIPGRPTPNINRDWDGVWHTAAQKTPDGWVAEIAIPWVTLRFPESESQRWGINLMRNIGRRNEQAFWAPVPKPYQIAKVSFAGTLSGMNSLARGSDLRVTPFVTSGASRVTDSGVADNSFQRDMGIDVKYGLTAGINLDVTLNTDFAQAEVDDEQVNLTRFPLFLPEKRDFFLENAGQFKVGSATAFNRLAELFFTRRIGLSPAGDQVRILAGGRVTGKVGRNDISVLNVQTDGASGRSGENFLVTRYSRYFSSRSRIGGLFINKSETDGDHFNRTFAVDMALVPNDALTVTGFIAKTETPGMTEGQTASYLNATWLDQTWRIYGEFADLGDNFNPEVGFLPRRGIRMSKLHIERDPRPDILGIRVMTPMFNVIYTTDQKNRLVSRRLHYMVGTTFDNGAYLNVMYNQNYERLDEPFVVREGAAVTPGGYSFGALRLSFNSNPARSLYYQLNYSPQDFYDGTRTDKSLTLGARVSSKLSAEASYARNDIDLPAAAFDVELGSLRIDYAMSPAMTLRTITQYNSSTDQWSTSARFRYTYRPGSDVYLVYDELRRDLDSPTGLGVLNEYRDRRLILKVSHLLTR
jgi:hypothetical protein